MLEQLQLCRQGETLLEATDYTIQAQCQNCTKNRAAPLSTSRPTAASTHTYGCSPWLELPQANMLTNYALSCRCQANRKLLAASIPSPTTVFPFSTTCRRCGIARKAARQLKDPQQPQDPCMDTRLPQWWDLKLQPP